MPRTQLASLASFAPIPALAVLSLSLLCAACLSRAANPQNEPGADFQETQETQEGPASQGSAEGMEPETPTGEVVEGSYLHLLVEVTKEGEADLISASEVPGRLVLSDYPAGPYLVEVRRGAEIVAVQSITDPFAIHGFGGPPGAGQEQHSFGSEGTATVAVKVPDADLADPHLDQLAITLYRRLDPGVPLERINPQVQTQLLKQGRLEKVATLGGADLADQIQAKSSPAEP